MTFTSLFFTIMLLINNLFLFLDYFLFPFFLSKKIKEPHFIVTLPRSGSTFLYHKLAEQDKFTSVKLWEIIFAPSILQKLVLLALGKLDKIIGSPVSTFIDFLGKRLMPKVARAHKSSIMADEEDDALTIWSLNSPYLQFAYGSGELFLNYIFFDIRANNFTKKRTMGIYHRMLQRHHFVFNWNNKKTHLAKSPYFMGKIESLKLKFPDAKVIHVNRFPEHSIASALQLITDANSVFSSTPMDEKLRRFNLEALVELLNHYEKAKLLFNKEHLITLSFNAIVSCEEHELQKLSDFTKIQVENLTKSFLKNQSGHKSKNEYRPLSSEEKEFLNKKVEGYLEQCI